MSAVVQGFWAGPRFSRLEEMCLKSFCRAGHEFHLYVYDRWRFRRVPPGVRLLDAREILDAKKLFKYRGRWFGGGSYAGFSEWFRFKLLHERGGWYADLDVTCLAPLDTPGEYFFRGHSGGVVGNVMKCPAGSALARECYERLAETLTPDNRHWTLPLEVLTRAVDRHGLAPFIRPDWAPSDDLESVRALIFSAGSISPSWRFIHWCRQYWRHYRWNPRKADRDSVFCRLGRELL